MTHTLNNSMAGFVPECNISFNGGDLSSDTGAILPLDFINSNSLLQPYADLPFSDERQSCHQRNSNFSFLNKGNRKNSILHIHEYSIPGHFQTRSAARKLTASEYKKYNRHFLGVQKNAWR